MRQHVESLAEKGDVDMKKVLFPADLVLIQLRGVSFTYKQEGGEDMTPVLANISVDFQQGIVLCVVGPLGHGKTTLLQLLGYVQFPDAGEVFVPPHLRILHVSAEVYFIEEEIKDNLFFGRGLEKVSDAEWQRALSICEKLRFPDRLMDYVQSKENTAKWMVNNAAVFSRSDRALMHIARAFIYNPEVLLQERKVTERGLGRRCELEMLARKAGCWALTVFFSRRAMVVFSRLWRVKRFREIHVKFW